MESFLRNYATPLSLASFAVTAATGLMLFCGFRGHALHAVHEWLGVIFVVALVLHLVRNWRGMMALFSDPRRQALLAGLGLAAALLILMSVPFGAGGRSHGARGPHGSSVVVDRLVQSPLQTMAPALGLSGDEAVSRLRNHGIAVSSTRQSLAEIAELQGAEVPRLLVVVLNDTES